MVALYKLCGIEASNLIENTIHDHKKGIGGFLAPLDRNSAFNSLLDAFRGIEEFINIPMFGIQDEKLEVEIVNLRLDTLDPSFIPSIANKLSGELDSGIVQRFCRTLLQSCAMHHAFRTHGLTEAAIGLSSVKHAIGYFQSRRRHILAMLYTIPFSCKGRSKVIDLDALNLFLPQVEHSGVTLTGLYTKLMLTKLYSDFELQIGQSGFYASYHHNVLDSNFLEPERANIMEMVGGADKEALARELLDVNDKYIFSKNELLNDIALLRHAYKEFDLQSTSFRYLAEFVKECTSFCYDEYVVDIEKVQFDNLVDKMNLPESLKKALIGRSKEYVTSLDIYAPFIEMSDKYISTVSLLGRFLYYWKTKCLNSSRRFQIRSGFIFEESVKKSLEKQGFDIKDIKRIKNKEFDVIAAKENVIFNFQCKNNFIDFNNIEGNLKRFVRINKRLEAYYKKALEKEEGREDLVKEKLGLSEIRHFVISRFPIVTQNPRIITYNNIDRFSVQSAEPESNL